MSLMLNIYEDKAHRRFAPLSSLRPVFLLRSGIKPLFLRLERHFGQVPLALICREEVAPLAAEQAPDHPVNILKREGGDVLFINGRIRDFGDLVERSENARMCTLFQNDGHTVAALFKEYLLKDMATLGTQDLYQDLFRQEAGQFTVENTSATLYEGLWDLVADVEHEITTDFASLGPETLDRQPNRVPAGAIVVKPEQVHLGEGSELSPGSLIDASAGPVFIGRKCRVEPQAAVYGPCYIGYDSIVAAGKVTGSSIGHTCRVGGEVEESIFLSCVNKYHAGFIGHACVGSWVNFGAMTTNSDLKNNYSSIRVSIDGEMIATGSIKVGSFIGDHAKFGIGTLLNTGINVGVGCNIFGGGLVSDKEIPPFRWGSTGNWQDYHIDKAIETARRVTERRGLPLTDRQEKRLRAVAEGSESAAGVMDFDIPVPA